MKKYVCDGCKKPFRASDEELYRCHDFGCGHCDQPFHRICFDCEKHFPVEAQGAIHTKGSGSAVCPLELLALAKSDPNRKSKTAWRELKKRKKEYWDADRAYCDRVNKCEKEVHPKLPRRRVTFCGRPARAFYCPDCPRVVIETTGKERHSESFVQTEKEILTEFGLDPKDWDRLVGSHESPVK